MNALSKFFNDAFAYVAGVDFNLLVLLDLCAFGAVFILTLAACVFSRKVRRADKRAFLYAVNLFTAVTLAVFCTRYSVSDAVAVAAAFWCVAYILYGLLCAITKKPSDRFKEQCAPAESEYVRPPRQSFTPSAPAAQNAVRLEHALSIADKLLLKNLGRGDRQELEKIKTALTVLKVKGSLSPQEGDNLNEMFNALLKLMAKYDL